MSRVSWYAIGGRVAEDDERGATVANVVTGNEADARLIAAAPDLLAALQTYELWFRGGQDKPSILNGAHEFALAAIAKATAP